MKTPKFYDEATQQVSYVYRSGALLMPIQGPPGTPARIVNVHAPCMEKVVVFRVKCTNGIPNIPDPAPQVANETLASYVLKPTTPVRTADGGIEAAVEGEYTHYLAVPLAKGDNLPMGKTPLDPSDPYTLLSGLYDPKWLQEVTPAAIRQNPPVDLQGVKPG